jgi:hypothetical protein
LRHGCAAPFLFFGADGRFAVFGVVWPGIYEGAQAFYFCFFFLWLADCGEGRGLGKRVAERAGTLRGLGILGNGTYHTAGAKAEMNLAGVSRSDVEGAHDEAGALHVDLIADESVDHFHEGGLDGFLILEQGDGMKARLGRSAHAANHALVKIAKYFFAQGGRAALDSVDLDVRAGASARVNRHGVCTFLLGVGFQVLEGLI